MEESVMQSVPSTVAEVDTLLEAINAPSHDMDAQAPESTAKEQAAAPEAKPDAQVAEEMWELSRKDVKTKVPLSKAKILAQQGLDYNEKMRDFNLERTQFTQEREAWNSQKSEFEKLVNHYKQIDDYFKANPTAWDQIQQGYNQLTGQQQSVIPQQVLKPLEDKIATLESFINEQKKQREIESQKAGNAALNDQIASFRKQYSDFDWDSLDENNLSLEQRIINHAVQNNIGTFNAAARDMLFEDIVKRESLKAKESVGKEIQAKTKAGVGPVTKTPVSEMRKLRNPKSSSYDNIAESIKEELGLLG